MDQGTENEFVLNDIVPLKEDYIKKVLGVLSEKLDNKKILEIPVENILISETEKLEIKLNDRTYCSASSLSNKDFVFICSMSNKDWFDKNKLAAFYELQRIWDPKEALCDMPEGKAERIVKILHENLKYYSLFIHILEIEKFGLLRVCSEPYQKNILGYIPKFWTWADLAYHILSTGKLPDFYQGRKILETATIQEKKEEDLLEEENYRYLLSVFKYTYEECDEDEPFYKDPLYTSLLQSIQNFLIQLPFYTDKEKYKIACKVINLYSHFPGMTEKDIPVLSNFFLKNKFTLSKVHSSKWGYDRNSRGLKTLTLSLPFGRRTFRFVPNGFTCTDMANYITEHGDLPRLVQARRLLPGVPWYK